MNAIRLLAAAVFAAAIGAISPAAAAERTVIVVLFDGFSPAMVKATQTPNLDRMAREGTSSAHLIPAFPTISLTNHTTFETGCWPIHHGIVSNSFIDPKKGHFHEAADADWHTGCEAIWEAAERQGVRAAALNFVGRWSGERGKLATYINPQVPWKDSPSDDDILKQALKLLADNGPDHPRLIAIYFRGPDNAAHYNGTTSEKALEATRYSDSLVGKLMAGIKALPPGREGTLIVGTDHGMMDVGPLINIGRIMNEYNIKARQASSGASAYLYLDKDESIERVEKVLSKFKFAFDVYRKGHFPAYAHLGTGPRVGDLLLVAKPPYWLEGPEAFPGWAHYLGITTIWPETFTPFIGGVKATHGYDPKIPEMHGIFYAWGSGIAAGKTLPKLNEVDVHPTVMALLGLQPGLQVDGHIVRPALTEPPPPPQPIDIEEPRARAPEPEKK